MGNLAWALRVDSVITYELAYYEGASLIVISTLKY